MDDPSNPLRIRPPTRKPPPTDPRPPAPHVCSGGPADHAGPLAARDRDLDRHELRGVCGRVDRPRDLPGWPCALRSPCPSFPASFFQPLAALICCPSNFALTSWEASAPALPCPDLPVSPLPFCLLPLPFPLPLIPPPPPHTAEVRPVVHHDRGQRQAPPGRQAQRCARLLRDRAPGQGALQGEWVRHMCVGWGTAARGHGAVGSAVGLGRCRLRRMQCASGPTRWLVRQSCWFHCWLPPLSPLLTLLHPPTPLPTWQGIVWRTAIIDEAHRMKSTGSSTRSAIQDMTIDWLLLLTGAAPCRHARRTPCPPAAAAGSGTGATADPGGAASAILAVVEPLLFSYACCASPYSLCLLSVGWAVQAPLCRTTCGNCLAS